MLIRAAHFAGSSQPVFRSFTAFSWVFYALLALSSTLVHATLLAATRLESCTQTAGSASAAVSPSLRCNQRFVVTVSVQNGQNATESISTIKVTQAVDSNGNTLDLVDSLEISLAKSQINLQYPLSYTRNYNSKPAELVRTADSTGRSFNFLTNACVDDASREGACGWVLDSAGSRVPSSNGFCCRCSLDDYFASSGSGSPSRANLNCALFSSSNSQSAHCLRMSPLWYAAFAIGAPQTQYRVDVAVKRCRTVNGTSGGIGSAAGSGNDVCKWDVLPLSPSAPGLCAALTALPIGANASPSPSAVAAAASSAAASSSAGSASAAAAASTADCTVWASLEGDFAAFDAAPAYDSKLLFVPLTCDDYSTCGNRLLEDPGRWLLVDRYMTTSGEECDKIGVAYAAFQGQGSRCAVPASSCLKHQLEDLYQSDLAAQRAGRVPSYFLSAAATAAGGSFSLNVQSPTSPRMVLGTSRFQKSVSEAASYLLSTKRSCTIDRLRVESHSCHVRRPPPL